MFDQSKFGSDWSEDELDAIVADYFHMRDAELSGRPYVKAHHRKALMHRIGRTEGSIEYKHENISAVLETLGEPWIPGYKPASHHQAALVEAVERYLSTHQDMLFDQAPAKALSVQDAGQTFVSPPLRTIVQTKEPEALRRLVKKFDPVARDFRNRQLGAAGEKFVVALERHRLSAIERSDLAERVRWVADEEGDGAGYDVLSFDEDGKERLIEVKTTNGSARTPFYLTRNERAVADERADAWRLYRVHLFAQSPRIFSVAPPLENSLNLETETWRASPL